MDYDAYAPLYAQTRSAVPWILAPLARAVRAAPPGATIVEIGCGTGNYVIALAAAVPDRMYKGFDLTPEMLAVARGRSVAVEWRTGDADRAFPCADGSTALAFAVDVVHHLCRLDIFFAEAARILVPGGSLLVVTDSAENMRRRSLTRFFPEILPIELARYPTFAALDAAASRAGLAAVSEEPASGYFPLDEDFIAKLAARCSSAMRLIPPAAHERGMARVRVAAARGESWYSCYTALTWRRERHTGAATART
jgi:S-adenosylmethionine-diacylgycerolhomoserine-N-methlytransferase